MEPVWNQQALIAAKQHKAIVLITKFDRMFDSCRNIPASTMFLQTKSADNNKYFN